MDLNNKELKELVYDIISDIKDPEFDKTYEDLQMVSEDDIHINSYLISNKQKFKNNKNILDTNKSKLWFYSLQTLQRYSRSQLDKIFDIYQIRKAQVRRRKFFKKQIKKQTTNREHKQHLKTKKS